MATSAELAIVVSAQDKATSVLKGIAAGVGFALLKQGAADLTKGLMANADAAAADAASQAKLEQAVENTGVAYADYKGQLDAVIKQGQKLAFTDDQTRDSLSILTAQTGSAEEATKRYALAQDLARGANIDVVTASRLLGKVTEENVNVLARYGISMKEGASEAELFGAIQEKFGGQAQKFGESAAGASARFKDASAELREELGSKLVPVQAKILEGFLSLPQPVMLGAAAFIQFAPAVAQTTVGLLAMGPAIANVSKMIPAMAAAALAAGPLILGFAAAFGVAYAATKLFGDSTPGWVKDIQLLGNETAKLQALELQLASATGLEREALEKAIATIKENSAAKEKAALATAKLTGEVDANTGANNANIVSLARMSNQLGIVEVTLRGMANAARNAAGAVAQLPADFGGLGAPGNAAGTPNWRGGMTWVGEHGPELVNLPRGSAIHSNQESMAMAGAGGGVTVHIAYASFNGGASDARATVGDIGFALQRELRARGV